jgi:hypothetical protein
MRARVLLGAGAALLAGPTVLAFFTGGYFDTARDWAGVAAWTLAALVLIAGPARPAIKPARSWQLGIGGLAALAAWTLASTAWAPIAGSAYRAGQIAVLYVGGLVAAALLLRDRRLRSAVEPAVAAGLLIVIGYGLSERLLPGALQFARSGSAQGRLEQPLTYWNAMGELAAIGLIVCARLAGDGRRPSWLRAAAAAAAAPLGVGLYASFSRGALFAAVAGLVALLVAIPDRAQLRGLLVAVGAAAVAAVVAAPLHGVSSLAGRLSTRETEGAVVLVALVVVMGAAAAIELGWAVAARGGALRLPRHAGRVGLAAI